MNIYISDKQWDLVEEFINKYIDQSRYLSPINFTSCHVPNIDFLIGTAGARQLNLSL